MAQLQIHDVRGIHPLIFVVKLLIVHNNIHVVGAPSQAPCNLSKIIMIDVTIIFYLPSTLSIIIPRVFACKLRESYLIGNECMWEI